jgi:hypothetical protein
MHYKPIQKGHMCNLVLAKDLDLPQVIPFIMTAPYWIWIRDAKDMAFGSFRSH